MIHPVKWAQHKWEVRKAERECDRLRNERVVDNMKATEVYKRKLEISDVFVERMRMEASDKQRPSGDIPRPEFRLTPYVPPFKNIVCPDTEVKRTMARDSVINATGMTGYGGGLFTGMGFPGFPYLSELTELTEYRDMTERTAAEMTRKWIRLRSSGEEKYTDEIKIINKAMVRLKVRSLFWQAAVLDGFFGRGQIFMDFGKTEGAELGLPLMVNKYSIKRGSLRALKLIEPITTYPAMYNADRPLRQDYYIPSSWWVYGQEVNATRLLTFVSRPLPDILKPVFNFSGISLSQLGQPYVDYWLNTRDSVGRLLRNFSTSVLSTNMSGVLQGQNYDNFLKRAQLYNALRDNQGLMLLDKETEEFTKHESSLSGLDKLQAQAQEHMAAVAKTPLVILLGITPSGLNGSDEQGLRIYYDYIADQQEKIFRANLDLLLKVIMLSELGEIIEDITFDFVNLMSMTEKERALIHKSDAEEAQILIQSGVVTNEEVRTKLAADPESGWDNLNVEMPDGELAAPAPPGEEGGEGGTGNAAANSTKAENAQEENAMFNGGDE